MSQPNPAAVVAAYLRFRRHPRSMDALRRKQQRGLQKVLTFALKHVPFYRKRVYARPALLKDMPILDKADRVAHFSSLNSVGLSRDDAMRAALDNEGARRFERDLGGLTVGLSSGTSGQRGLFVANESERALFSGVMLARLLPSPLISRRRDRVALFLRSNSRLYESVGSRRIQFSYFDVGAPYEQHLARLRAFCPTVLVAPPSLLARLANEARLSPLPIERVISAAEVLEPDDRHTIQRGFGLRSGRDVHEVYQATEGHLGQTCAEGTMHLNEDLVVVEKQWVDRASGRFIPILTDLNRLTQPMIRARLDDILVLRDAPCPCGSALMALEAIDGRADDAFVLPARDGGTTVLYPGPIRHAILRAVDCDYRVTQVEPSCVELSLESSSADDFNRAKTALCSVATKTGAVDLDVVRIEHRPRTDRRSKRRRITRASERIE